MPYNFAVHCFSRVPYTQCMMTSSNGNIFRVTGPLCGEFTGYRGIPGTKASDAELWCFLWSAPWINSWVNNREAGDLRRHRAQYDVIVMALYKYDVLSSALTHWGRDQIDAISQTTFSNAFSRMKMNEFRLRFHWSLFLRFGLTIFQHWFR